MGCGEMEVHLQFPSFCNVLAKRACWGQAGAVLTLQNEAPANIGQKTAFKSSRRRKVRPGN